MRTFLFSLLLIVIGIQMPAAEAAEAAEATEGGAAVSLKDALALGEKKFKSCAGGHWQGNPALPPRSASGRINAKTYMKQFPNAELEIVEAGIVPDGYFGAYAAGDKFGNSWLVAARGAAVGISHKSAPWVQARMVSVDADESGTVTIIKPDAGCGCGGTSDWTFTIPYSAPAGKYKVILSWEAPKMTQQKLRREYTVDVINAGSGISPDADLKRLEQEHGTEHVMVLRNGVSIAGETYTGVDDLVLGIGGYEGAMSNIIRPKSNLLTMGYWIVNKKASYYARGLLRFDLSPLKDQTIKAAYLKLSIKQNQKYLPAVLKEPFPIYAMKKNWKEGENDKYHVDKRGLSKGMPNYAHQAWPVKWGAQLASSPEDRTEQVAELKIDPDQQQMPGACADVTATVQQWLAGELENHGFIIGADLPAALNSVHPGLDGQIDAYKKLYSGGAVPFISSDESVDVQFTPRLIIVLDGRAVRM